AMGGEHGGRPRLDCAGAGGVRVLAAVAGACGRLHIRRGLDRPTSCTGFWHSGAVAIPFFAALSGNDRGSCSNLAQQASDDDEYASGARPALRAGSLTRSWEVKA